MPDRLIAVTVAHVRILARRRSAVLLMALLPLAFYGALYRHSPRAIPIAGVASAFAAGGMAIFSMLPARAADQRLALVGYRPSVLVLGRLLVLEAAGFIVALISSAVMIAGTRPPHPGYVYAGVILASITAVPLGLALGAVLPKELEAVLVLIGLVGVQMTADSESLISKLLPLHAAERLLDASLTTPVSIWPWLGLSIGYGIVLLALAWFAWLRRASVRGSHLKSPVSGEHITDGRRRDGTTQAVSGTQGPGDAA